jgi:hypothetical protein
LCSTPETSTLRAVGIVTPYLSEGAKPHWGKCATGPLRGLRITAGLRRIRQRTCGTI